ncbi:NAD(P)-binding protein [Pluteus cervinus]|uniref:NAD(P)-binding protein n=1 Tax=Pluteus cervinus TaxID=181527 RepID=A0ACD3AX46_9AGAR|nr:NAD(P)-binding protein [Pluteus cervinus]
MTDPAQARTNGTAVDQKVWFITGTSSGFGRRLVTIALGRGDLVIATARSQEKLEALVNSYDTKLRDNLRTIQLDVTEGVESITRKAEIANGFWGRIDVLVNNAGVGYPAIAEEGGSSWLRKQFETNVFGVMDVTTAVLPHLRRRRSGTVVVIGSRSAWRTDIPGSGGYAASKAAIHAITENLAVELASFNIRVLLVAPGSFRTEGILGQSYHLSNQIADYDALRQASHARFKSIPGTEKGDPDKAMEAVADVVRGEGFATGKPWPDVLILGNDAAADVQAKFQHTLDLLDSWKDVTYNVNFDSQ